MPDISLSVGDYVELLRDEYDWNEGIVWEIGDDYVAVIPPNDPSGTVTPHYIAKASMATELRPLQPKQEPDSPISPDWDPSEQPWRIGQRNGRVQEQGEVAGFDDAEIVAWLGPAGPALLVIRTRMTGVFGINDGSWHFRRDLTTLEWEQLAISFAELSFWSIPFDNAMRQPEPEANWDLRASVDGRQHEVWRGWRPNEIEPFCRLLFEIAARPGLEETGSSLLRWNGTSFSR